MGIFSLIAICGCSAILKDRYYIGENSKGWKQNVPGPKQQATGYTYECNDVSVRISTPGNRKLLFIGPFLLPIFPWMWADRDDHLRIRFSYWPAEPKYKNIPAYWEIGPFPGVHPKIIISDQNLAILPTLIMCRKGITDSISCEYVYGVRIVDLRDFNLSFNCEVCECTIPDLLFKQASSIRFEPFIFH